MSAILRVVSTMMLLAVLAGADNASAQSVEVGGGYTVALYDELGGTTIGWVVTIAAKRSAKVGRLFIVSELSGDYATSEAPRRSRPMILAFLDGARVVLAAGDRGRVFGEALIGIVHDEGFPGQPNGRNHFAAQPSVGIDAHVGSNASVRFQASLKLLAESEKKLAGWRFLSTLVFSSSR
jgi:hypothetical protein